MDAITAPPLASDLVAAVRDAAQRHPDAIAVEATGTALTYRELDRRAEQLGAYLQASGVGPEALVAVFVERSVDMYVAVLGIQRAGGAYVPIDPAYPVERIAFMLTDARIATIVTHERLRERLPAAGAFVVSLDRDASAIFRDGRCALELDADPARLAYTIYTSGSTGRPKGVLVEHGSVMNLLAGVNALMSIGPGDTLVALAPLAFDMSVLDVYWPLTSGARIVVASRETAQQPKALIALMERVNVSHMQATPSAWRLLVEAGWRGSAGLTLITGGETLPPALADQLLPRARAVWNLYGPTEATVWATGHRVRDAGEPPTIGTPMLNVSTYVFGPDGTCVAPGGAGDLFIGGAGVARGYLNRSELTAERFIPNPEPGAGAERLYKTGDVARYRPDGSIEFLGRSDHQVKLRGYRIELGEVENALAQYPGVRATVATVREDIPGDPRLIGYVAGDAGTDLVPGAVRRGLLETLPAYMVPDAIVVLETLPLNANGKVDRNALPAPARTLALDASAPPAAARTPLEARLVAIWEDVLDLRPIGIHDDFFDLGATSITAARVFERIERELGASLPLSPLFQAPTIERLARLIDRGAGKRRWTSLVPIQPDGTQRPVFCVHGGAGTILHFHALAKRLGKDQPFYGLQMRGLYGDAPPIVTVEAMAMHYVRELQTVAPAGPYAIVGYCFGGIVAFEMARQLRMAGENVALLASINGPSPAYIKRFGGPRNLDPSEPKAPVDPRGRAIFAVKRVWWAVRGSVLHALLDGWRNRLFDLRTGAYARFARPLPDAWRELANYRICHVAEKRYRPGIYDGAMLVFGGEGLYRRDDLGWTPFVRNGVDAHVVTGRHATQRDAMFEPQVESVAHTLQRALAGSCS